MIRLRRHQLFLIGVSVIVLFYFLNKAWFIFQSETTIGTCSEYEIIFPEGRQNNPDRYHSIIRYEVGGKEYEIRGTENIKLEKNEIVTVIYKKKEPSEAYQYSFFGFWYYGILYSVLSFLLLTLICFGAFEKHHHFTIPIPFRQKKKENDQGDNSDKKNRSRFIK
jgi:hypothetical protein